MNLHNECANCGQQFSVNSSLIVREITIQCPLTDGPSSSTVQWISVSVKDVLTTIYQLGYLEQLTNVNKSQEDNNQEIAVCGPCATIVSNLYRVHQGISRRRQPDSYVGNKLAKMDKIFSEVQQTWSQMVSGGEETLFEEVEASTPQLESEEVNDQLLVKKITIESGISGENLAENNLSRRNIDDDVKLLTPPEIDLTLDEASTELPDTDELEEGEVTEDPLAIFEDEPPKGLPAVSEDEDEDDNVTTKKFVRKRFNCSKPGCNKSFTTVGTLQSHIEDCRMVCRRKPILPIITEITVNKLQSPAVNTEIFLSHDCPLCQQSHSTGTDLTDHLYNEHVNEENPFQCPICNRILSAKGPLKTHIYRHYYGGKKSLKRISNGTISPSTSSSSNKVYGRPKKVPSKCSYKNVSPEDPAINLNQVNGHWQCSLCQKIVSSKFALTLHYRVHSGEKPHKCHLCDFRTAQGGNLTVHMKQHNKS